MNREELIQKLEELYNLASNEKLQTAFFNAIRTLKTTSIPAWYVTNYVLDETGFRLNCKPGA